MTYSSAIPSHCWGRLVRARRAGQNRVRKCLRVLKARRSLILIPGDLNCSCSHRPHSSKGQGLKRSLRVSIPLRWNTDWLMGDRCQAPLLRLISPVSRASAFLPAFNCITICGTCGKHIRLCAALEGIIVVAP